MLLDEHGGDTDQQRHCQGQTPQPWSFLQGPGIANNQMNRHSAGHMDGGTHMVGRGNPPQDAYQDSTRIRACYLPAQVQPVGQQHIDQQAHRSTCEHDKAKLQIGSSVLHHKIHQKQRNPQIPQEIRNHKPFIEGNPVIHHAADDIPGLRPMDLQQVKAQKKYKQISSCQTVFVGLHPVDYFSHTILVLFLLSIIDIAYIVVDNNPSVNKIKAECRSA